METSLTFTALTSLFGAMLVLAAVPSVSVLAVTARAASLGFLHGLYTTLGIVAGDIVFIGIAVLGLTVIAEMASGYQFLIRYAGACYLIVLGVILWRTEGEQAPGKTVNSGSSVSASFLAGLFITLGDQKAIFFYLGFFPAFVDVNALTTLDVALIVTIATVTLLGVKLAYAYMAAQGGVRLGDRGTRRLNRLAALTLMGVGVALLLRNWPRA